MFPLNSNQAYIKETGERSTLGAMIGSGGGSSELPEYSAANAGQVLTVNDDGELAWGEVKGGGYVKANIAILTTTPTPNAQEVTA